MSARGAQISRRTRETSIEGTINLDGSGAIDVRTGIGFLDHLLTSFAFHAGFDLTLSCEGDLHIDDHHTAEDCGIVLGLLLGKALGDFRGIRRFGHAYAPLDESLARAVVDLSGRPHSTVHLDLTRETLGTLSCENVGHVMTSMSSNARITVHVDVLRGTNDHHKAEAAFKALALAMRMAVEVIGEATRSTKGVLS